MTPEQFELEYSTYRHEWGRFVCRALHDHSAQDRAEDIVQEAILLRVIPNLPKIRPGKLDTCVRMACMWYIKDKLWRVKSPQALKDFYATLPLDDFHHLKADEPVPETATPLEGILREALDTLTDEESDIVCLTIYGKLSCAEIAKLLDLGTRQNVQWRFQTIMKKLRLYLGNVGIVDRSSADSMLSDLSESVA